MRFNRSVLLCLLVLSAAPALAETRYDVEVIVFEHDGGADVTEERWQPRIAVPEFERARDFDDPASGPLPDGFERLDNRGARLSSALKRLRDSSRYEVLRHLRWRQPALGPGESIPIRVRTGNALRIEAPSRLIERPVPARGNQSVDEQLEEADTSTVTEAAGDTTTDDSAGQGPSMEDDGAVGFRPRMPRIEQAVVYPLDGTIELVVSRYLHIHADLYYTAPVQWEATVLPSRDSVAQELAGDTESTAGEDDEPEANGEQTAQESMAAAAEEAALIARGPDGKAMLSFPFRQSRRMRSGELHYLDHPVTGLLVLVTPYEEEEAAEGAGSGGE